MTPKPRKRFKSGTVAQRSKGKSLTQLDTLMLAVENIANQVESILNELRAQGIRVSRLKYTGDE